jgi:conjugal transfer pilus assembly protein TraD
VSLVLGAQELSDVRVPGRPMLLEQVLGNLSALIAHRQVVPASADLIAAVAGTHGAWVSARRSDGTRTATRVREYMLHPDALKGLEPGTAAVIVHSRSPRIVRVFGPEWGV